MIQTATNPVRSQPTDPMKGVTLPSPSDRPGAAVVIFDGNCQFCRAQVARFARWDAGGRLAFLSLHDPATAQLCPDLSHEQLMEQMWIVDPSGQRYGGAAAIQYLSRRVPRMWFLAPALHLPFLLPFWQYLYRQVALRRYRWNSTSCENGACRIHHHS